MRATWYEDGPTPDGPPTPPPPGSDRSAPPDFGYGGRAASADLGYGDRSASADLGYGGRTGPPVPFDQGDRSAPPDFGYSGRAAEERPGPSLYPGPSSYSRHRVGLPAGSVWDGPTRPARRRTGRFLVAGLLALALAAGAGAGAGWYASLWANALVVVPQAQEVALRGGGGGAGQWIAVAADVLPGVVSVEVSDGDGGASGSGFVLDDEQHIVTNDHVIAGGGDIFITSSEGRRIAARLVGRNSGTDIAVLRIAPSSRLRALPLGASEDVRVGELVLAIGSPLGLSSSVTAGIVSAVDRQVRLGGSNRQSAVQTDASINPGNSGGPLVNARGQVIGVNTAIATLEGNGSIGIGFAIPIDRAADTARQIISGG